MSLRATTTLSKIFQTRSDLYSRAFPLSCSIHHRTTRRPTTNTSSFSTSHRSMIEQPPSEESDPSSTTEPSSPSSSSEDNPFPRSKTYFNTRLITPTELHSALQANPSSDQRSHRLIPLSAAWFLPNDPAQRTGLASYTQRHIPGSRFFDLDSVIDKKSPYPHMLPSISAFMNSMKKLGIKRSDTLVVYDTAELGLFSAPRVAWTLEHFGHSRVHVLNNFKTWVEDGGFPVESGEQGVKPQRRNYMIRHDSKNVTSNLVASIDDVRGIVESSSSDDTTAIIDARPRARWEGTAPEPREGISSGHMPGSISLPFSEVLDPETKTLLPREKLREVFEERFRGDKMPKKVVSTCGTGVTAAVVDLALREAGLEGFEERRVYDGSWTEWASVMGEEEGGMIVKGRDTETATAG